MLPEDERVPVLPSATDAIVDEWNKIGNEQLRRGVVTVMDRTEVPLVGGRPVFVEVFGVAKTGVPIPPATPVFRLIITAVPSNTQQTTVKGVARPC